MFSTTFQKYKENPIPPNIKLPKHKKYKPASLFFPTFVPKNHPSWKTKYKPLLRPKPRSLIAKPPSQRNASTAAQSSRGTTAQNVDKRPTQDASR